MPAPSKGGGAVLIVVSCLAALLAVGGAVTYLVWPSGNVSRVSANGASVELEMPNGTNMFAIEKWVTQAVGSDAENNLYSTFGLNKEDLRFWPQGMKPGETFEWSVRCLDKGFLEGGDMVRGTAKVTMAPDGAKPLPELVTLRVNRDALKQRSDKKQVAFAVEVKYRDGVILQRTENFWFMGRQRVPFSSVQGDCPECGGGKKGSTRGCKVCKGSGKSKTSLPWQFVALVNPENAAIKDALAKYKSNEHRVDWSKFREGTAASTPKSAESEWKPEQWAAFCSKLVKVFLMFREIDAFGLEYDNLTGGDDLGRASQECRTVTEVLTQKRGNCIELTALLCSLFEAAGGDGAGIEFQPVILLPPGHAIAGVTGGGGDVIIESTLLELKPVDAKAAYEKAKSENSVIADLEGLLTKQGHADWVRSPSWWKYWVCVDRGFGQREEVKQGLDIGSFRRQFGVASLDSAPPPGTPPPQSPSPSADAPAATVKVQLPNGTDMFAIEKWVTQAVGPEAEANLYNRFRLTKEDLQFWPEGMQPGDSYDWSVRCLEPGFLEGGDTIRGRAKVELLEDGTFRPELVTLPVKKDILKQRSDKKQVAFRVEVKYRDKVVCEQTQNFWFIGRQRVPKTTIECADCRGKPEGERKECKACSGTGSHTLPWQYVALVNPEAPAIKKAREEYRVAERQFPKAFDERVKSLLTKSLMGEGNVDVEKLSSLSHKLVKTYLLFREIDRLKLSYSNLTGGKDASRPSQECRTISEVIQSRSGNCIELTTVLLSLFEAVGSDGDGADFDPVIMMPPGHAIAGISGEGGLVLIEATAMAMTDADARASLSKHRSLKEAAMDDKLFGAMEEALRSCGREDWVRDVSWVRFLNCVFKGHQWIDQIKRSVPVRAVRQNLGVVGMDSSK